MPKPYTFPVLLDSTSNITTRFLIDNDYLKPGTHYGTVTHYLNGNRTGSALIKTIIKDDGTGGKLELSYSINGGPQKVYPYDLITKPSNLGRGRVWYIVCPATGKNCRKLHQIGGQYLSRHAFPDAVYRLQTESKDIRQVKQYVPPWPEGKRTTYAGLHTKAYVRHKVAEWKAQQSMLELAQRLGLR
jgi:hypothetical protein